MSLTHLAGLIVTAAMLVQAGGGEPVSAATIPAQEPAEATQPDFDRFVTQVRDASASWTKGEKARASAEMARALADYSGRLQRRYPERELTPIEQDVLDIRNAVRDPKNFEAFGMSSGRPYRAAVLDASVKVSLSNRSTGVVTVRRPLADRPWTLYLTDAQIEQLASVLGNPLAGTADELWRQFLGVTARHQVVGWSIRAHPAVVEIKFLNARRTSAEVTVLTSDFTGGIMVFQKRSGRWTLVHVGRGWVA